MGFATPNQVTDATLANPGDTNPLGEPFARYRCRATITGSTLWKAGPFFGRRNDEVFICSSCWARTVARTIEGLRCEARLRMPLALTCSCRLTSSRK